MHSTTKLAVAGFFTASALTFGIGSPAVAAPGGEPCAKQATQLEKAEDALARVTAVFEKQHTKKAKKAKKAQQQRVTKAQQRLDDCLAAQPSA